MAVQSKEMELPPWGGAVAGAAGGVLANTLVYPLDLYDAPPPLPLLHPLQPLSSSPSRAIPFPQKLKQG
jgi:hypothetical protein